jgi:ATP-dependent Clp protease ATP-binding subunit ClpX
MDKKLSCDFCGAKDKATNPVIAGGNATICQSCAKEAYNVISKHKGDELIDDKNKDDKTQDINIF